MAGFWGGVNEGLYELARRAAERKRDTGSYGQGQAAVPASDESAEPGQAADFPFQQSWRDKWRTWKGNTLSRVPGYDALHLLAQRLALRKAGIYDL